MPETTAPAVPMSNVAAEWVSIEVLNPWPKNPRVHNVEGIARSMLRFGYGAPAIGRLENREVIAGHGRIKAATLLRAWFKAGTIAMKDVSPAAHDDILRIIERDEIPVRYMNLTPGEAHAYALADNQLGGEWDDTALTLALQELKEDKVSLDGIGWNEADMEALLRGDHDPGKGKADTSSLADRFLVPPFSILDARQGYWRDRKAAWIALGIKSELGRFTVGSRAQPGESGRWAYAAGTPPPEVGKPAFAIEKDWSKRKKEEAATPEWRSPETGHAAFKGGFGPGFGASADRWNRGPNQNTGGDHVEGGLLFGADSARDPTFYAQKRAIEAKLGREIETAEFLEKYYKNGQGETGLSASGTSVFDPVLCEIVYRWFSPPRGAVLDPFSGGSVRGIVASKLGRAYTGIDLSAPQVKANGEQWLEVKDKPVTFAVEDEPEAADFMPEHTPVERVGEYWVKRDDLYQVAGVNGGKVRTCWHLAQGATGLITAGSRESPQVNIVAHIARRLGIPCRVHTPTGELSAEVQDAKNKGAEVVQHPAGYNNVIIARAREDAAATGWREIPFGMECEEATVQTRKQLGNIPAEAKRIVIPVGSGMSLAGLLWGLREREMTIPVLGVVVGADPEKRLDKYAPPAWRSMVELVKSPMDYHAHAPDTKLGDVVLDPVYEAKAIPFLKPGDLLWVVGIRRTARPRMVTDLCGAAPRWVVGDAKESEALAQGEYDLIFSCPPYYDLEVYSDDPRDISTMTYAEFIAAYRAIIAAAVRMLRPDRFAVFVVGDVREENPSGYYRNFVSDTIAAFQDAGARLYNEAMLITTAGTLPVRVARQFSASRKLGKTHQNVLVFCKGDPRKATEACGPVEVGGFEEDSAPTEPASDGTPPPPTASQTSAPAATARDEALEM